MTNLSDLGPLPSDQLASLAASQSHFLAAASSAANVALRPSIPRISMPGEIPPRRVRPPRRPSTASSAEERPALLPAHCSTGQSASSDSSAAGSSGSTPPSSTASSSLSISATTDSLASASAATATADRGEGDGATGTLVDDGVLQETNRRAHPAVVNLRAEASKHTGCVDSLPSPFDPSPLEEGQLTQTMTGQDRPPEVDVDYDWATFINAYALGRWDPLKTPHPPRSHLQPPSHAHALRPESRDLVGDQVAAIYDSPEVEAEDWHTAPSSIISYDDQDPTPSAPHLSPAPQTAADSLNVPKLPPALTAPSLTPTRFSKLASTPEAGPSREIIPLERKRPHLPPNLGLFNHRIRNSFTDVRPNLSSSVGVGAQPFASPDLTRPLNIPSTDSTTAAAAIRWAAARVSIAPLALPSPEHELTDPMRGMTATIPGSHPSDYFSPVLPVSPGVARKSRLSSFWEGTQDIEEQCRPLPTIEASPPEPPPEPPERGYDRGTEEQLKEKPPEQQQDKPPRTMPPPKAKPADKLGERRRASDPPFLGPSVPPATAPVRAVAEGTEDDYFGAVPLPIEPSRLGIAMPALDAAREHPERQTSAPPFGCDPVTVPALPRRICLTRQTSAPLPTSLLYERRLRSARPASEASVLSLAGRAAKEEQMFLELGFLAPPNPPNELERRRALYKFNIWNTGRDANFDRIVHLVKLVFNPKIATIALVDGQEEFFKSESGFGTQNVPRTSSFDAHAILQRDDEPMVVLDARDDWRFQANPLVMGQPHIRFYAGCPLRTQDGYNIGTLAIMDDTPRREFSPRQRHTLKEFAQITIRELELWKDKIQLRIRDKIQSSMEQFTRECLEVDKETSDPKDKSHMFSVSASMEQIYERAARLVKRTLDVEGALVLDVSHVDVVETVNAECTVSITVHSADEQGETASKALARDEYARLAEFFDKNPDGRVCEGIVPTTLRPFLPARIQYALTVPIFNVDKRPFALLCAYSTGERTTPFLEGHELSYLRAIGVIILSAVLKRRMVLADKAKGLFISNISHELRTPLHGILASAELLSETRLDHSQASFLQTVQACGTSLVETVNHVLDFTKLSGNAKAGGVENIIHLSKVDLMQLVEEATEGCWIGHRARTFTSEIGSVYSPPKQDLNASAKHVETVLEIGNNENGWTLRCEKGGIRRVLMNLFGNSLKFTSDGYVHVILRQLPPAPNAPPNKVRLELSVIDTGKGISQGFLKNRLFHPFSQENPLQTGTGLGLAIVNSIVTSREVDGKVDVWSSEGVGTEIKVTFTAETVEDDELSFYDAEVIRMYEQVRRPTIALQGFDSPHRGIQLLRSVISSYLTSRWNCDLSEDDHAGDIAIVNEDFTPLTEALERKDPETPFIVLSSFRGDLRLMSIVKDYETIGGFARILYKPVGPGRLGSTLKLCLHSLNIGKSSRLPSEVPLPGALSPSTSEGSMVSSQLSVTRRYSEEKTPMASSARIRPSMGQRAATVHPLASWSHMSAAREMDESDSEQRGRSESLSAPHSPVSPTVSVGTGGTLLKSSVGTLATHGPVRVLVVEDNSILRNLLVKWLRNRGYEYREAVDGQEGVNIFESDGRFDVVLVDLSMPVLDGIGATTRIRAIESSRQAYSGSQVDGIVYNVPSRILALTGMSSIDDKRRAFNAGVDGYLVKPVAFKTLDTMFHKLGVS